MIGSLSTFPHLSDDLVGEVECVGRVRTEVDGVQVPGVSVQQVQVLRAQLRRQHAPVELLYTSIGRLACQRVIVQGTYLTTSSYLKSQIWQYYVKKIICSDFRITLLERNKTWKLLVILT